MNWKGQGRSRCSVVGMVTLVLAGRFAVRIMAAARGFSLYRNVQTDSGAHPFRPSSYPWVKLPGREVDHSLMSSFCMLLTWRTLPVLSLSGNYTVILSIRKILNQSFRLFHMSCIYLFIYVLYLGGTCEKKEVHMNMCLILNGYRVRAADVTPLDVCLWNWMNWSLAFWILLPT
jgi:hypothetical protein